MEAFTICKADDGTILTGALRAAESLASGDTRGAQLAAGDACHATPHRAGSHSVYGQAWAALGEPVRAAQAFAEAVRLRPDAWANYGASCYRQGSVEDTRTAIQQALFHAPGHRAAVANLGAFLRITGDVARAVTLNTAGTVQVDADTLALSGVGANGTGGAGTPTKTGTGTPALSGTKTSTGGRP